MDVTNAKIAIIGLGYVGLPLAAELDQPHCACTLQDDWFLSTRSEPDASNPSSVFCKYKNK